jgi:hypothetical protein
MNYIYDIETLSNCFTVVFEEETGDEIKEFVIHESRDDSEELLAFLHGLMRSRSGLIGFNNKHFDWPVLFFFMGLPRATTADKKAAMLYGRAQSIINTPVKIYENELIPQLDLYLINHFDNKNKATSLKAVQVAIKWHNVMDMPIHHSETISEAQIPEVLFYNKNDVSSTKAFLKLCKGKIELRKKLSTAFKQKFINKNDVAIGESIFVKYLSSAMGVKSSDIRRIRGNFTDVPLENVIFPYISFRTPEFQKLLVKFKSTTMGKSVLDEFEERINNRDSNDIEKFMGILDDMDLQLKKKADSKQKKGFGYHAWLQGIRIDYGIGGVHACAPSGVYSSDDEYVLRDSDVKSYYPNIAIRNKLHPRQFRQDVFSHTYEYIYNQRVEAQKTGDKVTSDGLKLSLNGVFGKSLDKYSSFLDPTFFAGITINGQLMLTMFVEMVIMAIPKAKLIQLNTDGVTFLLPRNSTDIYDRVCEDWMSKTQMVLEHADYSKMIIRDVNNYFAVKEDGGIKEKGAFEIAKEYHKDPSFAIIQIAVINYFIKGTPVIETLKNHPDIYDFCARYKGTAAFNAMYVYLGTDNNGLPCEKRDSYGKIMRYIPTIKGGVAIKVDKKGKITNLLSGRTVACFNTSYKIDRNIIDYTYFEWQCKRMIESVMSPQMNLELK